MLQQKCLGGDHHARGAEAALHRAHIQKGTLDDLQHRVRPGIFNGFDGPALQPLQHRHAGAGQLSVDQHTACAAMPRAAGFLGSLHALDIPQILQQCTVFLIRYLCRTSIQQESDHMVLPLLKSHLIAARRLISPRQYTR